MLSKSVAKAFFLVGTGVMVLALLGLTFDTFGKIPAQTHSDAITAEVAHGKRLWEENNCMGCHTLMGEGAYYAPELTRVMERRGEVFVRGMLRDPEAMYPGERKMVQYDFSEEEVDALVAFLAWVGNADLNGFPPKPTLHIPGTPSAGGQELSRAPALFTQACVACHSVGGLGGSVGPQLDGVADRRDGDYLRRWLQNPADVKSDAQMPNLQLKPEQIDEMVAYLQTLKAQP